MTTALQIVEAVQTILIESDGASFTISLANVGISGPRGFTGLQGPPGPPGPLSTLNDLADVELAAPQSGDILIFSSPQNLWTNMHSTKLVDGGNF